MEHCPLSTQQLFIAGYVASASLVTSCDKAVDKTIILLNALSQSPTGDPPITRPIVAALRLFRNDLKVVAGDMEDVQFMSGAIDACGALEQLSLGSNNVKQVRSFSINFLLELDDFCTALLCSMMLHVNLGCLMLCVLQVLPSVTKALSMLKAAYNAESRLTFEEYGDLGLKYQMLLDVVRVDTTDILVRMQSTLQQAASQKQPLVAPLAQCLMRLAEVFGCIPLLEFPLQRVLDRLTPQDPWTAPMVGMHNAWSTACNPSAFHTVHKETLGGLMLVLLLLPHVLRTHQNTHTTLNMLGRCASSVDVNLLLCIDVHAGT